VFGRDNLFYLYIYSPAAIILIISYILLSLDTKGSALNVIMNSETARAQISTGFAANASDFPDYHKEIPLQHSGA
jgi:hypothetical protein